MTAERPKHSRASATVRAGLFNGVVSFKQLEHRIAALPTEQERGAAFEVFAEGYFATQPIEKAKNVWPGERIPQELRRRLYLHSRDVGVDGLIETVSGTLRAYQVKFRTGRPSLRWEETATFFGLTDRCRERVLFTNCDDLSAVMDERRDFSSIRGCDLDRLEPGDFKAIREWLRGAQVVRKIKKPRPHQTKALRAIIPVLRKQNRVTVVMACGTGKTQVALWTAEAIAKRRVLVLVPSLALLRQTLKEWVNQTKWPQYDYLCVCSDPTVSRGEDELVIRPTELEFSVSTEPRQVRQFLQRPFNGVKIIFSTYQSAAVVAKGMRRGDVFDLAIFDEAHKTAGLDGTQFSFALKDQNLPIRKRLFLTATPRHYNLQKRDKEGDPVEVFSMNRPEIYGPVVHNLTFAEAARRGIICNYKVIISVVTSKELTRQQLRHGQVPVKRDRVKAAQVANQIALAQAVRRHPIRKIFTFHRTVDSAASFTADGAEGIQTHLKQFGTFHVRGSMPSATRERVMDEFRAAPKGVMSNARCLTEGIDCPAVDMVAFLTPKRSRVDIVQATGRAMRRDPANPSKVTGYIFVPLYVEQAKGESLEAAIERTEFDEVWAVLQAMQEQDAVLADIIRQMREERGRTKGFDDTWLREKLEVLGPNLSLGMLRNSITTACLDRLGVTWDERYGELKEFRNRFGHCNVPQQWSANLQLGQWVRDQRKKRNRLCPERILRLEEIGFVWDPFDVLWEEMFSVLLEYRKRYGDCDVPDPWPQNPKLSRWVSTQRKAQKEGNFIDDRKRRLTEIGFRWNPLDDTWNEMFSALTEYRSIHGDCNVPLRWRKNPKLGKWVLAQRKSKNENRLDKNRSQQLAGLGFMWNPHETSWETMLSLLIHYKTRYGNCNVPHAWPPNPKLGRWVSTQRKAYARGYLTAARKRRLDQIGFAWQLVGFQWEQMYSELIKYKKLYGHCRIPKKWAKNPKLALWLQNQRARAKHGLLSTSRLRRLEEIGFSCNPFTATWEVMFASLVEYKKTYGHCKVPAKFHENPKLGRWVYSQRLRRRQAKLSRERIRRLNVIGFQW